MAEETRSNQEERSDIGPDPVWGLAMFIVGLVTMAFGGAFTLHWTFVIGEAFLLLGVVWFLGATTITRLKQDPIVWREKLPAFLGGTPEAKPAKPRKLKRKKAAASEPPPRRLKKKKVKRVKKKKRKRVAREEG